MNERDIFIAALQINDEAKRESYLKGACAGDVNLRVRVNKLLCALNQAGSYLEQPAVEPVMTIDQPITAELGKQIGPYKLREQLGEGGMGVVYVAEQTEPVKRKVALKIIKPGMASKDVVVRFEAERQALAMMDHPNIARVFDGGATESGQPYFVMELVCGVSLAQYCDEHALTTDERLKVFLKVCRAVQHAHQKGIIHRDLKPSNVLVASIDDQAVPKVIDFGVAKAAGPKLTEETVYTHVSQLVGTPLYMSPEQVELGVADVDTRSDVYSLGVLLYELLTGNTPFDSETLKQAGFDDMRRIIREDEPPKPSVMVSTLKADALSTISECRGSDPRKLSESLSGELDWLVMKSLEKDRNRRYESASAFAADIERFLNDEPVEACPPSISYRFQKLAGKHKAAVTTAAIVAAALVLGVIGTSWQAWRATHALAAAEKERTNATQNFTDARDALDDLLERVEANQLLQNPDMHALRDELLSVARNYYRNVVDRQADNPDLQRDLADAHLRLGDIAWTLGDNQVGDASHSKAVRIYESLVAASPKNDELRNALVLAALTAGKVTHKGQPEYLRTAVAAADGLEEPDHRFTAAKANLKLAERLLSLYQANTGDAEQRDEAVVALNRAEQILTKLDDQFDNPEHEAALAKVYELRGTQHYLDGDFSRGREFDEHALAIFTKLAELHPDQAEYRKSLADLYGNTGRHEEAIEILRPLAEQHPTVLSYQERLIDNYRVLGREQLDYAELAIEAATKLVERYPENIPYQSKLGTCLLTLGQQQSEQGETEQAVSSVEAAIEVFEAIKPSFQGHLGDAYSRLHELAAAGGDVAKALVAITRAIDINGRLQESAPENIRFAAAGVAKRLKLAALYRETGKPQEALAECEIAAVAVRTSLSEARLKDAPRNNRFFALGMRKECHRDMGLCLKELGRYSDSAEEFRAAIIAEAAIVRDIPRSLVHESPNPLYDAFIAACQACERQSEIALVLKEELETWRELESQSAFPDTCQLRQLEIQLRLAEHLLMADRLQEAAEHYRQANHMLDTLADQDQIRAKTFAACRHVTSSPEAADLPECPERATFIETLRELQDREEASEGNFSTSQCDQWHQSLNYRL